MNNISIWLLLFDIGIPVVVITAARQVNVLRQYEFFSSWKMFWKRYICLTFFISDMGIYKSLIFILLTNLTLGLFQYFLICSVAANSSNRGFLEAPHSWCQLIELFTQIVVVVVSTTTIIMSFLMIPCLAHKTLMRKTSEGGSVCVCLCVCV